MAVDIVIASGKTAQLVTLTGTNSGTNTLAIIVYDEDNAAAGYFGYVGNAASNTLRLPSIGASASTTSNLATSQDLRLGPGTKLSAAQSGAGAQNDTLTVAVQLLLPITAASDGSDVSWSVARSSNAGDVTLAASTISAANTMQAVLLP